MPYVELLTRSLRIAWRHRWLWLLALFAAETGGGGFSSSFNAGPTNRSAQQFNPAPAYEWIQQHAALLVAALAALIVIWIVLFLLSCACAAATVRGVREIEAGAPVGLGRAWELGLARYFPVLRLRLVLLLVWLVVFALLAVLAAAAGFLFIVQSWVGLVAVLSLGAALIFDTVLLGLALSILTPIALRAAVLESATGWAALRRAYAISMSRTGRVLACWGLMVASQLAFSVVAGIAAAAVAVPAGLAIYAAFSAGQVVAGILGAVVLAVVLGGALIIAGAAFAAFYSTFWTLAYPHFQAG